MSEVSDAVDEVRELVRAELVAAHAWKAAALPLLQTLYALDAECPLLGQPDHRILSRLLGRPSVPRSVP